MAKGKGRIVPNKKRRSIASADNDTLLRKVAFQAASHTRANIQHNGQIDTSFMLNSVYVVLDRGASTYSAVTSTGMRLNRAGHNVYREVAAVHAAPKNGAIVAVGANYAYWQERRKSFLRKAMIQTSSDFGNRIKVK